MAARSAGNNPRDDLAMEGMETGGFVTIFRALVFARWIHFASVFVLFGSAFFRFHMGAGNPLPAALRATRRLITVAAPVAALSGAAWLVCILANMTDGFASAMDAANWRLFFLETQFGPVAIARLALLAGGVLLVLMPWRGRAWHGAIASIGALLLVDQAWLGHAAEGGAGLYGATMIFAYSVHVLAAGAWVGGLPPLLFALVETGRAAPKEASEGALHLLQRFSIMGMVAVVLIVATGAANAGFRVGFTFDEFFGAEYGLVLAVKAALVAAMLALAFFNRFIFMPRLRAASDPSLALVARLRASVGLELALGVLVLGVAAVLGVTPPPQ